ncbi:MAG: tRNA (adenosine(37)-N6)-dimethylallyltransferase MiaA [Candidatus Kerfeldbacteria bacterium]|nr:tRNA (adenosine(37)-N6)-dimethylallyltransferase MiaA [Candidatus Kerfeldbacteria bacterium]
MSERPVIVILGPTAAGKSALGIALAKRFGGVIISADSRQVYRGLDIGTGKLPLAARRSIPHYLIDVASPRSQYTVDRFVRDVRRILDTLPQRTPVFLVGGSPFYIDAVTKPNAYSSVPPNPALRQWLEQLTTAELNRRLKRLDRRRWASIDHANRRRLIRAIEIAHGDTPAPVALPAMRILKLGLRAPLPKLRRRIDRQISARLRAGMIRETAAAHHRGVSWKRLAALGLEYRVIINHLRDQLPRNAVAPNMKKVTYDFVRRQLTWWKRDQAIRWVTPHQAIRAVATFLQA